MGRVNSFEFDMENSHFFDRLRDWLKFHDLHYHGTRSGRWTSNQPNMQEIPNNRINGETIKSSLGDWRKPPKEVRLQTPEWMLKRLLEKLGEPIEFEEI